MKNKNKAYLEFFPFSERERDRERVCKSGFTLVELIVVITILAILGTIAFISLSGYSAISRDSVRISDIWRMKTSLELFHLNVGKYPLPDQYGTLTYQGNDLFYQGYFGENVVQNVSRNMSEFPKDPLTEQKYIYSVSANRNELEILALLEGDIISLNTISQTNAAGITVTPKITGNYNGLFIKTKDHIVPLPSVINTEVDENTVTEITQGLLESMVINGGENVPKGQGNIVSNTGALTGLVLTGALNNLTKDSSDADKAAVIEIIKSAYSGSSLKNGGIIEYILNLAIDDTTLATAFDTSVLNEIDTATVTVTTVTPNSCDDATKPVDDLNKTYTINPTSINQAYVQDSTECGYTCTGGYTGINCAVPNPYANCTGVNTPAIGDVSITAATTYGSCNTADIIICSGNEAGYTISSCNVGTNTAGTTTASYGGLFQWGNHFNFRGGQYTDTNVYPTVGTTQVSTISNYSTHSTSTFIKVSDWTSLDSDGALRSASWNPCTGDYHVPTYIELYNLTKLKWDLGNANLGTNMKTDLKMPMAGFRSQSTASLTFQGVRGYYYTSSSNGAGEYYMYFNPTDVRTSITINPASAFSVRCFKN